jgi:nucleoside-diphosphate-sugar epimerase
VVHAAAHLGDGGPALHRRVNAQGTHAVLAAAAAAGVARVVHLSTIAVHARKVGDAIVGASDGWDPHPELRDDYAASKIGAEQWVRCFAAERNLGVAVLRPGIVWGGRRRFLARVARPGPRGTLVVLGSPDMRLPMVHVADVVEAVWRTLSAETLPRAPLHVVGPDAPTQAAWLAARDPGRRAVFVPVAPLLRRLAGRAVPARWRALGYRLAWATQSVRYDRAPLAATLGWQPEIGITGPPTVRACGAVAWHALPGEQ